MEICLYFKLRFLNMKQSYFEIKAFNTFCFTKSSVSVAFLYYRGFIHRTECIRDLDSTLVK